MHMQKIPIVYEDTEILIVHKRAGIAVQGGARIAHPLDMLLERQLGYKVYPVHRLDRDTDGLLVAAKSPQAAARWSTVIASDAAVKQYAALTVGGEPVQDRGILTETLYNRGRAQEARTQFSVTRRAHAVLDDEVCTACLLALTLQTGRMHQIRRHLAHAGYPIAADDKYGNFARNRILKKQFGIQRLQLAAVSLTVPIKGKSRTFSIPYPAHMTQAIQALFSDFVT